MHLIHSEAVSPKKKIALTKTTTNYFPVVNSLGSWLANIALLRNL
jgi:hypothetical protein